MDLLDLRILDPQASLAGQHTQVLDPRIRVRLDRLDPFRHSPAPVLRILDPQDPSVFRRILAPDLQVPVLRILDPQVPSVFRRTLAPDLQVPVLPVPLDPLGLADRLELLAFSHRMDHPLLAFISRPHTTIIF